MTTLNVEKDLGGIETTKHYRGSVELKFNTAKHHYTINGETMDGVTTILKAINKPLLVPWAAKMTAQYVEKELKKHAEKKNAKALDEVEIVNLCGEAKKAHRKFTKEAGNVGTLLHEWIENWVNADIAHRALVPKLPAKKKLYFDMTAPERKKQGYPAIPRNKMLKTAVGQFLEWVEKNKVIFKCAEQKVVSLRHKYCGTYDFIAEIDGKLILGDIKTSKGIWDEYWFQLAAYKYALQEEYPTLKIDHTLTLRCGKDGSFEVKELDDYAKNIETFLAALTIHRRLKEMKYLQFINS